MKKRHTFLVLAAAVASVAGTTLITGVGTAHASNCPSNAVCLHDDSQFAGTKTSFVSNQLPVANIGRSGNDKASSITNNLGVDVCFFVEANYGGSSLKVSKHTERSNVGNGFNDRITSLRTC